MKKLQFILVAILVSSLTQHTWAKSDAHASDSHANKNNQAKESHGHERHKGPVSAEEAFKKLANGNKRYLTGKLRLDGHGHKERKKLVEGQSPYAIVLSCSDSRVPPELVFDQGLGEIFVIRSAGQALDSSTIASIEYAVSHLGSNLIVVMGHESCGAVKAALGTLNGGDAGSIWLNNLVKDLHPRLKKFSGLKQSDGVKVESWSNVNGVAFDLMDRSEIISNAVKSGDVEIKKALYHLGSGNVEWHD